MSLRSVQFIGVPEIMTAYKNRGVDTWAIFQDKQFMFKGSDEDELKAILEMLSNNGSMAIYTLKIFEDIDDVKEVKGNTPDDGSFNFRVNHLNQEANNLRNGNESNSIISKLNAIEKRLEEMENEEEEEAGNDFGVIGKIISHPSIAPIVPQIINGIMSNIFPYSKKIAGISNNNNSGILQTETGLLNVVNELKKYDQDLEIHLNKLLTIAKESPENFKLLISYLN